MVSRDEWKKFLLTLPDAAFFALARHYLGELQTPFTKHRIIVDLERRLTSPDWTQARRALVSEEDLDALAAIKVLGTPTPEEAASFLGWDNEQFRSKALNLQERLLAFPAAESRHGELAVSPLVLDDPELAPRIEAARLYPWLPAAEPPATPPRLHEGSLLALLAFLLETPLERTAAGGWRKKPHAVFLDHFAALGEVDGKPRAELLLAAAEALGLVNWQDGATNLVWSYIEDFAALPRTGRLALLWLAPAYPHQTELFEAARHFEGLRVLLTGGRAFALTTLVRLSAAITALGPARRREALFQAWIQWGLLVPGPSGTWMAAACLLHDEPGTAWLQSNYELRLPPDQDLGQSWRGALACRLVRWDTPLLFELDRAAVKRLLARGVDAEDIRVSFETLSGAPLAPNLAFSLKDWGAEHRSLQLWKGTVLTVDNDRRHLIEHTEHFARAVIHSLAPGVWLVREDLLGPWSRELEQKGLPPLPEITVDKDWGRPWTFAQWTLDETPASVPVWPEPAEPRHSSRSDLVASLLQRLDELGFAPDEKEEWRARILRRTVLTPDQLTHPLGRGERFEAKGLDYGGKLRLAELAVASPADLLEVAYRGGDGETAVKLVRPTRLEKQDGEALLLAEEFESRRPFQAWISRLSQVRKIKGSLIT
jgi:hypothetical protein